MHLEKLAAVLKTFDKPRLKRLKAYVKSPYFNVPPVCAALLERLIPLHPQFKESKMQPQNIGKKHLSLSTLGKQQTAGSNLLKVIEKFIAQEEWQKSNTETFYQLQGFQQLPLTDEFNKGCQKLVEQLNSNPEQQVDTFYQRHLLTELTLNGFAAKLNRTTQNDIMPVVKTLDEFYALKKIRYLCEALNRKQGFGANYQPQSVSGLLDILKPYTKAEHTYPYLFVNVYCMITADNYEDGNLYYQLIKQFAANHPVSDTVREVMDYTINHLLLLYSKGYDEAGNEYLWWIEWKAKHNLLLQNNRIMPITFRNVVRIAVANRKKVEWITRWVNEYAPHLPQPHDQTNKAFANGLCAYATKNYVEAIRLFLLAQTKEEVMFNGSIRIWEWRCLYEYDPNDIDTLHKHLQTFKKFLLRHKAELKHLYGALNRFVSYSKKLLTATPQESAQLYTTLEREEHFAGKYWLIEQFALQNKKARAKARAHAV